MIRLENVSKRYGRRLALAGVSFDLLPGEIALLLGANGAGKSSLLRCVLGITDYEGSITVEGLDPARQGCMVRSLVGYMPQAGGLHPDLSVAETVQLYSGIRGAAPERGRHLLEEAGLVNLLQTKVGELSGGMRQRLGFMLALLADPQILILDEPSASLDAASRSWLAGRLRELASEGRTILVSTHAGQELLDIGDRRIVLEDGRLVSAERVPPRTGSGTPSGSPGVTGRRGRSQPVLMKEVKDAVSNRWLMGYAIILGVLGLAAAAAGLDSSSGLALQAFGRTTATLMNLCLLLAPLIAVLMGASSIAGERERGTLEHLLAQPLSRSQLLLAKYAGILLSLTLATLAGFAPAGLVIAREAGPAMLGHYLLFPLIATLVSVAMLGVGVLVSVSSRSAVQAQGAGVCTWFAFVLLYDLLLMGTLAIGSLPIELLAAALAANPIDAARVLGVLALEPELYLLGPAGAYLTAQAGRAGAAGLLLAAIALWATVPLALAIVKFGAHKPRRRALPEAGPLPVPGIRRPATPTEVTFS
jgi:Cu-processing system permease protein